MSHESLNFIERIIEEDASTASEGWTIRTRFPPEPNGYLHIGHAKAICLNFTIAEKFGGLTNLRFDDTNPVTEDTEYVEAIKRDIKWLGFDWEDREYYASDYFEQLYQFAVMLINKGLAYVDDSTSEEIAEQKGDTNRPGTESRFRNRSVEENLRLFTQMKDGVFEDGSRVLRAKIDMASPNLNMRDPVMYRIKRATHHRTGDSWLIYPMYDFAHGQSDSIEGVTHSLCSLEFENHRPLYDWFIQALEIFPSRQIEFARMNVEYMITSKRRLLRLVEDGHVSGWDDPRMSTISGMRRRGYTPRALRTFCDKVGIAKRENLIELSLLESCVRDDLNKVADRVMAVLDPVKVVIDNYPKGDGEILAGENNPEDEAAGSREIPFSREIYIERSDFMEDPPRKYFRLGIDRSVRLKHGYIIHCHGVEKDNYGAVSEIHCTYHPDSKSGEDTSRIKVKGTLHWVSVQHAISAKVNIYEPLFTEADPLADPQVDMLDLINPHSLVQLVDIPVEPSLAVAKPGQHFQFMRKGYFVVDQESSSEELIFNRTVTMRDSWSKKMAKK